MEAKHESTKHFVTKTGDKVIVEIEITGNPDNVVGELMKSIRKDVEIFEGARVSQIFFAGKDLDSIVEDTKNKIITGVNDELLKVEEKMTGKKHSVDFLN